MTKPILLLAAWLCLANPAPAAVPPAEKLLPEDTQVLVSIPDFSKAKEIYRTATQTRLWEDPAMKPFRDKFFDKLKDKQLSPFERELGIHFTDYTNLPQGQVTFALVPTGEPGKDSAPAEPGMLLLVDVKDKSAQLRSSLAELKKKWTDAGKQLRSEKIRDVEFSVVPGPQKEPIKTLSTVSVGEDADKVTPAPKTEFFVGQSDSLLIVSDSAKVIEKILAIISGGGAKTLDDSPVFTSSQGGLFRQAAAFAWMNPKTWLDQLRHLDDGVKEIEADSNPFSFKWEKLVSATGLSGLKAVSASFVNSPDGAEVNVSLAVPESSRAGLFKILAGEPKDSRPPSFVPATAVKFQRWRLDGQKTWATLQKILGDVSPQLLNSLNLFLSFAESSGQLKDPDFSIKKSLIGNLGDDIIGYAKTAPGGAADPAAEPSLTLIGSPNGEQLALAIKSVFAMMGEPSGAPKEREFRGHKIYSIPQPTLPGVAGAPGPARSINYSASGGYLALSDEPEMLEEYLRSSENQEKSLRDKPGFADAMQKVLNADSSLFGYSNGNEEMRGTFESLKKNPSGAVTSSAMAPLMALATTMGWSQDGKISDLFDFSLLPPFDQVSKYFYVTVYGASADSKGLKIKIFMPTPPQLGGN